MTDTHNYGTRLKDRSKEEEARLRLLEKQRAANVIVIPRLKPVGYTLADIVANAELAKVPGSMVGGTQYYIPDDSLPINKRGFKYKPCRPHPDFPANLYATTDIPPFTARFDDFDHAIGIQLDQDAAMCTSGQGWRLVRSNVAIREGRYYFEFEIVAGNNGNGHVRVGLARKEASLEAPVGFDGYSYGIRDVNGELMTLSRPKGQLVEGGFKSGDVIGFLVEFPLLSSHRDAVDHHITSKGGATSKARKKQKKQVAVEDPSVFYTNGNIVRDQVPIKYKNGLYYEQFEYTATESMTHLLNPVTVFGEKAVVEQSKQDLLVANLPTIPNSKITVFKNGVLQSPVIENIYSFLPTHVENDQVGYNTCQMQNQGYRNSDDGSLGYYPMALCFKGGVVKFNLGPDFKYPVDATPLCERYQEQVVEDWMWDVIDEIEGEYLDSFQ